MHHELQLDHACQRLRLAAGTVLHCHQGTLWMTRECAGLRTASPDTVLHTGQRHRIDAAGDYFLTPLGGCTARCSVEPPPAAVRRRWILSVP